MTIVPFPNNFNVYFQNAMGEIAVGNFDSAVAFINKALAIQMDDDLFNIGLSLLQQQNHIEQALNMIHTHKAHLFTSTNVEEVDLLLITLLIETGSFEEAEKQIKQRWATLKNNADYAYLENVLEQYLVQIADEKKRQTAAKTDEVIKKSRNINEKPYFLQLDFVKSLGMLSDDDLERVARPLLIDKAIHPFIKTEIITVLHARSFDTAYNISKHGMNEPVIPKTLYQPDLSPFYLAGLAAIDAVKGTNIIASKNYQEVLFLHTLYFYPLEKSVFQDSKRWLQAIMYPGEDSEYDFHIKEAEKGLDLLT